MTTHITNGEALNVTEAEELLPYKELFQLYFNIMKQLLHHIFVFTAVANLVTDKFLCKQDKFNCKSDELNCKADEMGQNSTAKAANSTASRMKSIAKVTNSIARICNKHCTNIEIKHAVQYIYKSVFSNHYCVCIDQKKHGYKNKPLNQP